MTTTTKTDAIRARIRALLARTTQNGCTEAEAAAAAAKAGEMLDEYGWAMEDLQEKEEIVQDRVKPDGKRVGLVDRTCGAIAAFCDCKSWKHTDSNGNQSIVYFGREADVSIARYLTSVIERAMEDEWQKFRKAHFLSGRAQLERTSFHLAMARRLNGRLLVMKAERNRAVNATTGRTTGALVLVKNAEVENAFAQLNPKLRSSKSRVRYSPGNAAWAAGVAAGDRLGLHTAIGGSQKKLGYG